MNETAASPTAEATPRLRTLACLRPEGFRRMSYAEWGNPHNRQVAVCVHGLTRNGRDFDFLARALLAAGWRVLCPDVVGRGRSEWLDDPQGYAYPHYVADMNALLARSGAEAVDWIGTSMGGIIGMMLAAMPESPIRRLVINDVGGLLPKASIEGLMAYVGKAPAFASPAEAEAYLRSRMTGFGPLAPDHWAHIMTHGITQGTDGQWRLAYDPAIRQPLEAQTPADVPLWMFWDRIRCPVLLIRGAESDLLLPETVAEMRTRGPGAQGLLTVVDYPACGHAPSLMPADQIAPVVGWLEASL